MAGVALPCAVKVGLACLWIASEHVLNLQFRAGSQGVVNLLVQKMCEGRHLFGFEGRRGASALQGMALREKRTDSASVAIAQYDERTDQVGPLLIPGQAGVSSPRLDAMAGDAFSNVDGLTITIFLSQA